MAHTQSDHQWKLHFHSQIKNYVYRFFSLFSQAQEPNKVNAESEYNTASDSEEDDDDDEDDYDETGGKLMAKI